MYKLSRVMLIGAAALLVYSTVVLCLIGGWPGWIVLGLLLGVAFKRKGRILAQWAQHVGRVRRNCDVPECLEQDTD